MEFKHISVLLDETIEELHIKPDGIYVDGTLGGGGHAYHVCQKLSEKGRYIGIDQDADAIAASTKRLEPFKDKVTIVRDNYVNMPKVLHDLGIEHVDGILLDLGVSSFQLDEKERGFTYREDVPLDMRMDQRQSLTARDIVNEYSEMELFHIIRDYGEEKFAKNIAKHIVNKRKESPIETTGQLIEVIKGAIPMKVRAVGGHPAKKTFQAIRIECNRELDVLKDSIDAMEEFIFFRRNALKAKLDSELLTSADGVLEEEQIRILEEYFQTLKEWHIRDIIDGYDRICILFAKVCAGRRELLKRTKKVLENAFLFLEKCFGKEQELLLFETELTADDQAGIFISSYGCAHYFQNCDLLLYQKQERELQKECRVILEDKD